MSLTLTSAPTSGNVVVCGASWNGGGASGTTVSIKDGNNNSYTIAPHSPSVYNSSAGQSWVSYLLSAPANASASITATFGASIAGAQLWCDEFSISGGVAAFDTDAIGASSSSGTAVNGPSITPSTSNELFYGSCTDADYILTVNSPWTGTINNGNAAFYDASVSSALAVNCTQQYSNDPWTCALLALKVNTSKIKHRVWMD